MHVSVHGGADIGSVLAFTLLLKKIERIGDQAKNILELAETADLAHAPEREELLEGRRTVSALFAEAAELLGDPDVDEAAVAGFDERAHGIAAVLQEEIDALVTTDRPGREAVPLAIYHRYVRRIVANLAGVVRTSTEPITVDHADDTED